MLPEDANILLSYVNTKLRDEFSSLDDLCETLDADREELERKLAGAGYHYDAEQNCFRR